MGESSRPDFWVLDHISCSKLSPFSWLELFSLTRFESSRQAVALPLLAVLGPLNAKGYEFSIQSFVVPNLELEAVAPEFREYRHILRLEATAEPWFLAI